MNRLLPSFAGLLALILGITGCATPYSQPSSKPAPKAPVVDRSTRPTPAYPTRPTPVYPARPARPSQPGLEVGQLPREDPLIPREYSAPYPEARYPTERYPTTPAPYPTPAYPPGAAYPPYPDSPDASPSVDEFYGATSEPSLPVPQPEAPSTAVREDESVALAPPIEPAVELEPDTPEIPPPPTPAPQPAPPRRPAELPPAEITREGNQAVVALLDSADQYVKSNELDKAGAALERALRIEPRNAGIWHDLAQIRLHQGQYQQAESLASKSNNLATGNRPLQARNWKLISVARRAGGNPAGAEEAEAQASLLSR